MMHILHAGEGEHLLVLTELVTIKISARDTANQYTVIQETVPLQGGPPHQHAEVEIILRDGGRIRVFAGRLAPADSGSGRRSGARAVPGRAYFMNVGTAAGKLLVTLLPDNFQQFLRAVGTPVGGGGRT